MDVKEEGKAEEKVKEEGRQEELDKGRMEGEKDIRRKSETVNRNRWGKTGNK